MNGPLRIAEETDAVFVQRVKDSNDHDAFAELHRRHQCQIRKCCSKILNDPESVADATQNTFLKAWTGMQSFNGRSKFLTWLTRIAINESLMIIRKRRLEYSLDNILSQVQESKARFPAALIDNGIPADLAIIRHDQARNILSVLPKGCYREAIYLRFVLDLSVKESAEAMRCTVGRCKSRQHNATVSVRRRLNIGVQ